jgi:hypothetical protein
MLLLLIKHTVQVSSVDERVQTRHQIAIGRGLICQHHLPITPGSTPLQPTICFRTLLYSIKKRFTQRKQHYQLPVARFVRAGGCYWAAPVSGLSLVQVTLFSVI